MQRGSEGGGLGPGLAGERISVGRRVVSVVKQLGEGGFSFVYLVKDNSEGGASGAQASDSEKANGSNSSGKGSHSHAQHSQPPNPLMVLKITSIHSRQQRDIAEKEAKLLSRLSHPSIVKMVDACYRSAPPPTSGGGGMLGAMVGKDKERDVVPSSTNSGNSPPGVRPQHMILMEYCEGGHALDVCNRMHAAGKRFDLPSLIIAFGQICNAVSYLHAQRPPIVHRDLKPVNFLVKNGAYKLCDFGSAVFGHVELKTPRARTEAEEVIEKTTTQMFRAPEMVDLYMAKKLTQSTDVWALGCCLYSLAFFQNCFEEGSNLAILSRNYKIPENNPYGDGLVELIDRMLTFDCKARADMTEVILCLSAIYSGRPLPPRKKMPKAKKSNGPPGEGSSDRVGAFRTDGQGMRTTAVVEPKKPVEAKKLNPNSAAARRRRAAHGDSPAPNPTGASAGGTQKRNLSSSQPGATHSFGASFSDLFALKAKAGDVNEDDAFSTSQNPFANSANNSVSEPNSFDEREEDKMFGNFVESPGGSSSNKNDTSGFETEGGDAAFPAFEERGASSASWGKTQAAVAAGGDAAVGAESGDRFERDELAFPSFGDKVGIGKERTPTKKGSSTRRSLDDTLFDRDISSRYDDEGYDSNSFESMSVGAEPSSSKQDRISNPLGGLRRGKKAGKGSPEKRGSESSGSKKGITRLLPKNNSFRKGKVEV